MTEQPSLGAEFGVLQLPACVGLLVPPFLAELLLTGVFLTLQSTELLDTWILVEIVLSFKFDCPICSWTFSSVPGIT